MDSVSKGKLLIVDDAPVNVSVLFDFLSNAGFEVLVAPDGERALRIAEHAAPDLILLDVIMPGMDGFEVCRELKARPATRDIPVVFMTALADTVDKVRGFELGALDYLTKPVQYEEILARVNIHLNLRRLQQALQNQNTQLQEEIEVRRRTEHSLQETAEALRQRNIEHREARCMAEAASRAKTRFLANMSHELRTPLNAILGYSDMLEEEVEDRGACEEMLPDIANIKQSARQLLGIVTDVLELTKIEAETPEVSLQEFELESLLEQVTGELQPLLRKRENRLEVRSDPQIQTLYADFAKIRQILGNLLSNAAKFTHRGKVELSLTRENDQWLTVRVSDNGIGIPSEHLEEIFQPFWQVDGSSTREYGGTGLGLTIVRAYTRMLGGHLSVESEPGQGSRFILRLPYHLDEENHRIDLTVLNPKVAALNEENPGGCRDD